VNITFETISLSILSWSVIIIIVVTVSRK